MPKPLDSKDKSLKEIEKESLIKYLEKQEGETGFINGGYAWFKEDAEGKGTLCYYGKKGGKAKEIKFDADEFFEFMGGKNVYGKFVYSELQQIFEFTGVKLLPEGSISREIREDYSKKIKEDNKRREYLSGN